MAARTLYQAILQAAESLDEIRIICDRTHEENLLAERTAAGAEYHYAYALGAIMQIVTYELAALEAIGIRRAGSPEDANTRALASLQAFRRSLRAELDR